MIHQTGKFGNDVPLVERVISRNIPGTCISVNVAFNLKIVIVKYICVCTRHPTNCIFGC